MSTTVDVSPKKSQPASKHNFELPFEPPTATYLKLLRRDEAQAQACLEAYLREVEEWGASMKALRGKGDDA